MNNKIPDLIWEKISTVIGETRADLCLSTSLEEYKSGNFEAAYILSATALDIYTEAEEVPEISRVSESFYGVFNSLRNLGRHSEAADSALSASRYLETLDELESKEFLYLAADAFYRAQKVTDALSLYKAIANDPLQNVNAEFVAKLDIDIAFCLQDLKSYDQANIHLNKARQHYVSEGEPTTVAFIDEELSQNYYFLKMPKEALSFAKSALDFAIFTKDNYRLQFSHHRMGLAKHLIGENELAIKHLQKSKEISIAQKPTNWGLVAKCESVIILALESQGKRPEAEALRQRLNSVKLTTGEQE